MDTAWRFGVASTLTSALLISSGTRAEEPRLEPVVVQVTAQDQADSLSRSSLALDADAIRDSGVTASTQLEHLLPGMTALSSTPRQSSLFVRGLGVSGLNDGLDTSVGLYVDGHFFSRPAYAAGGVFDLAEVQLLRGVSDATMGPGSVAGELRLSTEPPTSKPAYGLSVSAGTLGYSRLGGYVSGPIGESDGRLSGRLSFERQSRDGLLTNQFDGQKLNKEDNTALRGQLVWRPRGDLSFRLSANYGEQDQTCCTFPLIGPGTARTQASDAYMGYQRVGSNPYDRVADTDNPSRGLQSRQGIALNTDWQLDPIHRLVSLTALRSLSYRDNINDDGSSLRLLTGSLPTRSWQVTQELRWHRDTPADSQMAGLFLMREDLKGEEVGVLGDEIFPWAIGGLLREQVPGLTRANSGLVLETLVPPQTFNGLTLRTPDTQVSDTVSVFGSSRWQLSPRNQVSAGLRANGVSRSAEIRRSRSGGNLSASPLSLTNSLAPIGLGALTFDGLVNSLVGENFERTDRRRDSSLGGRLAFERSVGPLPTDPWRIQGALSRGVKAGGINLAGLGGSAQPQYESETVTSVELGLRGEWLRGRMPFGLTAYRTWVEDYQALTYNTGEGLVSTPRQNNILNIPKVKLTGLEADASLKLPRGFEASVALAYSRAVSTEFPNAPNPATLMSDQDLSGRQLYNAPLWSGAVGIGQTVPVEDREFYWAVQQSFRSSHFLSVEQSPTTRVDAYGLIDLRLGLRHPGEGWTVEGWVRNLTDEDYLQSTVALYGLGDYGGVAGQPRMVGVTVSVRR